MCVCVCVCDMDKLNLVNSPCFTLKEENEKMFGPKSITSM